MAAGQNLPYNINIPDAPNNPSNDQPLMKDNTNSTNTLIGVDHYSFNDDLGGNHKQVTFGASNTPAAINDANIGVLYTVSGNINTNKKIIWAQNKTNLVNDIVNLSAISGFYVWRNGTQQKWNCQDAINTSAGVFTVQLDSIFTATNNVGVVVSSSAFSTYLISAGALVQFQFYNNGSAPFLQNPISFSALFFQW